MNWKANDAASPLAHWFQNEYERICTTAASCSPRKNLNMSVAADTAHQNIFSTFSWRPRHIVEGMIKIPTPPASSGVERAATSPLGALDWLPLELLHTIVSLLDLKTLPHVKRTCLRGINIIDSLPEFRDLMHHAPRAMAALGSTRLIHHFSAQQLHTALRSSVCVSCGAYGAFFFLSTAERRCYGCLRKNQGLWMMSASQAKSCSSLSPAELRQLPIMRSLPGKYSVVYVSELQRHLTPGTPEMQSKMTFIFSGKFMFTS